MQQTAGIRHSGPINIHYGLSLIGGRELLIPISSPLSTLDSLTIVSTDYKLGRLTKGLEFPLLCIVF